MLWALVWFVCSICFSYVDSAAANVNVLALHVGPHDNTITSLHNSTWLVLVLPSSVRNKIDFLLPILRSPLMIKKRFDIIVHGLQVGTALQALRKITRPTRTAFADHCYSHCLSGFWDSPFQRAVTLVTHGIGHDEAPVHVYNCSRFYQPGRPACVRIRSTTKNPVTVYSSLADRTLLLVANNQSTKSHNRCSGGCVTGLMLASLEGTPNSKVVTFVNGLHRCRSTTSSKCLSKLINGNWWAQFVKAGVSPVDILSSIQHAFQAQHAALLDSYIKLIKQYGALVLTGGGGFNIVNNRWLQERMGVAAHVPPSPGDRGISIGQVYQHVHDPHRVSPGPQHGVNVLLHPLRFLPQVDFGPPPSIADHCQPFRGNWVDHLYATISKGHVVVTFQGMPTLSPFHLKSQAMLGPPTSKTTTRMAATTPFKSLITFVVPVEAATTMFSGPEVVSPYTSFVATLRPHLHKRFGSLMGTTVPVQTVSKSSSSWLYPLLWKMKGDYDVPLLVGFRFQKLEQLLAMKLVEYVYFFDRNVICTTNSTLQVLFGRNV